MTKFIKAFSIVLILLITLLGREYHQNYVKYKIDVKLDDSKHFLEGKETIVYYNNFPDTLKQIDLLLYPNAYKTNKTMFAKQQKKYGNQKFWDSKDHQRGFINITKSLVNNSKSDVVVREDPISTGYIKLDNPLLPGDSVEIYTEWQVKIPYSFSRMCHSGQKYYISQWFPKIPVYDHDGWHPYPYLTIGEFYYEFGDYEVNITLPDNYVVAATGELTSPQSEHRYLDSLANVGREVLNMDFKEFLQWQMDHKNPPSSENYKTLTFTAKNVVDFAWTASKEHLVQKSNFAYENSTDSIGIWNFFLPKNRESWKYAIEASEGTLRSYGKLCGHYPYPNVTTVDGDLIAGGGMEYPMLTIINSASNQMQMWQVIAHEIGHNWFYGILGFNERMQPWMDEGLNTYGEMRFMSEEFPDTLGMLYDFPFVKNKLKNLNTQNVYQVALNTAYYLNYIEPGNLDSYDYETSMNYFISVYQRPAMGLRLMEQSVGTENFTIAMNAFYEKWKFKHPQPEDMQVSFENTLQQDLNWFFGDYIQTDKQPDYKLTDFDVKKNGDDFISTIELENKGEATQPFDIVLYKDGKELTKNWYFNDEDNIEITTLEKPDKAVINPDIWGIEENYLNNYSTLLPPIDANLIFEVPAANKYLINYLPYLNYNYNEGFKIGGGLYHLDSKLPKNMYMTYGYYSTKTEMLNWAFRYRTKFVGKKFKPNLSVVLSTDDFVDKISNSFSFSKTTKKGIKKTTTISGNYFSIKDDLNNPIWTKDNFFVGSIKGTSLKKLGKHKIVGISNLDLISLNSKLFYKYNMSTTLEQKFVKYQFNNRVHIGFFIGQNEGNYSQFLFFPNGGIDPGFDQFYVYDRSGHTALDPINNYFISDGANLKGYQRMQSGDKWSFGYNSELKQGLFFIFFDAGNVLNDNEDFKLVWDAGFGLDLKLFQFYFPLYVSDPFDGFDNASSWKAMKKRWMMSVTLPKISILD